MVIDHLKWRWKTQKQYFAEKWWIHNFSSQYSQEKYVNTRWYNVKSSKILYWIYIYVFVSGVGFAGATIAAIMCTYYIVICAWAFFYLFSSFTKNLPWGDCFNYWNDIYCNDPELQDNCTAPTGAFCTTNDTYLNVTMGQSPAQQFWE